MTDREPPSLDSPEQMLTEVTVAHRLGYWWGTSNAPVDEISDEEIAEADAYLNRFIAQVRAEAWFVGYDKGNL
ncbi:hypothetical protein J2Y69_002264 [Microbacterium resistens]|uniref:Uncharacterized protein n=1 Tax=Microbacterium resistens TaxID=156977 RepID=A0ABU1SDI7_9MICO|nr:hypothetical protein [Microbacterium resistens]MDR6867660.1 hypothetical protein [Microbacterium resistens]